MRRLMILGTVLAGAFGAMTATTARAANLTQGFELVSALAGQGWRFSNQSTQAANQTWRQGNPSAVNSIGPAPDGAADSYALTNFTETTSTASTGATISNWMITPSLAFNGVDHTLTFKTRTATASTFPDRLEVRLSNNTNQTGTGPTDVGDFTTLLLSINPNLLAGPTNYPQTWTQFSVTIPGAQVPANGFVAWRYHVTNAGPNGLNSNIIGVDTVNIVPVPEPAAIGVLAISGVALLRRRRSA
jgi:hypothetical protein